MWGGRGQGLRIPGHVPPSSPSLNPAGDSWACASCLPAPGGGGTGRLPCTAPVGPQWQPAVSYLCFLGPPVKGSTCLGVLSSASVSGGPSPSVGRAPWELVPHQKQAATCCHLGMRHLEMPEIGRNLKFWRAVKVVLFVRVAQTKPCAGHSVHRPCFATDAGETSRAAQVPEAEGGRPLCGDSCSAAAPGPGSGNKKDLQLPGRVRASSCALRPEQSGGPRGRLCEPRTL